MKLSSGLCSNAAGRLIAAVNLEVEESRLPGAVVLVQRGGQRDFGHAVGDRDPALRAAMREDAIFRIYSMTKALSSSIALMLSESGELSLDDPVARYLPVMKDLRVWRQDGGSEIARRAMTIRDLLRNTSGISGGVRGTPEILRAYREHGIQEFEMTEDALDSSHTVLLEKLARAPLAHHPGTAWEYGRSADVLGCVLEVVEDKSLDEIFAERLTGPLDMCDTGFWVHADKIGRVAHPKSLVREDGRRLIVFDRRPRFLSAGSGVFSTAGDYSNFLQMLLDDGMWRGRRVMRPESVRLLTSDQIGPLAMTGPDYIPGPEFGFGFGMAVRTSKPEQDTDGSRAHNYWLGRASTSFLLSRESALTAVFMAQCYGRARHYQSLFQSLIFPW